MYVEKLLKLVKLAPIILVCALFLTSMSTVSSILYDGFETMFLFELPSETATLTVQLAY